MRRLRGPRARGSVTVLIVDQMALRSGFELIRICFRGESFLPSCQGGSRVLFSQ